ncbi:translation initiation factor IF-3, partial [Staphylococcus aureus]|uniref:translation initiation factor IF-3 n=1 Tax=Staphylococcus aureus TaxID=1280 RepID=UPI0021090794
MSTIAKDQTQSNDKIRAKELRLIGQDGEQIGVKSKREALEMAERVDLDLVGVAPNAKPPVARIMDDYVHNLKKFLSEGQIVKAKILSIDDEGKLNLSLKDNDY